MLEARSGTTLIINGLTPEELAFSKAVSAQVVRDLRKEGFHLSDENLQKVSAWISTHGPTPASGIGGRYTYCFTPTGLGVVIKVIDNLTSEELDLTNYSLW
jgi:hypothetical protein